MPKAYVKNDQSEVYRETTIMTIITWGGRRLMHILYNTDKTTVKFQAIRILFFPCMFLDVSTLITWMRA